MSSNPAHHILPSGQVLRIEGNHWVVLQIVTWLRKVKPAALAKNWRGNAHFAMPGNWQTSLQYDIAAKIIIVSPLEQLAEAAE